jgi:hypothetical protein
MRKKLIEIKFCEVSEMEHVLYFLAGYGAFSFVKDVVQIIILSVSR